MKSPSVVYLALGAVLLGGCVSPDSVSAYRETEQEQRSATAIKWNRLTTRADEAIGEWLKRNAGEEQIHTRRYYTFWKLEPHHETQFLVLLTGLKPARGNYWSVDFVVVRDNPALKPIIVHFGNGADRYVTQVVTKEDGFQVDYVSREQGDTVPRTPGRSMFFFLNDALQEVVMRPDQTWEQTSIYRSMHAGEPGVEPWPDPIYEVGVGDNQSTIARTFEVSPGELVKLNPGVDWSALKIGQRVRVRAEKEAAAESAK